MQSDILNPTIMYQKQSHFQRGSDGHTRLTYESLFKHSNPIVARELKQVSSHIT